MPISSRVMDSLYTYRFLRILTKSWEEQEAYKLGIIDDSGNILKKRSKLKTDKEKSAYTMFHSLVWNIKKLINKVPGGKSKVGSYVAAMALIKEDTDLTSGQIENLSENLKRYMDKE